MGSADNRPLTRLLAACETLLSDVGEASMRTVAMEALTAYADLGDDGKLQFFAHVCTAYDVDAEQVRTAFHHWDDVRRRGSSAGEELIGLFNAVEPRTGCDARAGRDAFRPTPADDTAACSAPARSRFPPPAHVLVQPGFPAHGRSHLEATTPTA